MDIKGSEAVFSINLIGDRTNETYMGNFKVRCLLSPIQEIQADRTYRELLGTNSHLASEYVRQQAFALAQLEQRIIEAPPFWYNSTIGGGHIEDSNVLLDVLDKAIESQEKFYISKKKELEERQKRLTDMIKNKKIEKELDIESVDSKDKETEEEEDEEITLG